MDGVSLLEAAREPQLRQDYMDGLVDTFGKNFEYVGDFEYLSNEDIRDHREEIFGNDAKDLSLIESVCVPESTNPAFGSYSNVYHTQRLYDGLIGQLSAGIATEQEIEHLLGINLAHHQYAHAEHYMDGIPGIVEEIFSEEDRILFTNLTQLEAHKRTIVALGEIDLRSNYLKSHQSVQIKTYGEYFRKLRNFPKSEENNEAVEKGIRRYSGFESKLVKPRSDQLGTSQIIV